jgi:C-terminal processing protease CtpA/Prc
LTILGLSLAKRMGHDGIFIRNIVAGSLADQEGSLKVGDQLLMLDGKEIVNEHPNEIIEMLKQVSGSFELVVKREFD